MKTLYEYLNTEFVPEYLPTRGLSGRTKSDYDYHTKVICQKIGHIRLSDIDSKLLMLNIWSLPPYAANKCILYLRLAFQYAISKGYVAKNPALAMLKKKEIRKRNRLTDEFYYAMQQEADSYMADVLEFAKLTVQRPDDLTSLTKNNIRGTILTLVQKKTKQPIEIEMGKRLQEVTSRLVKRNKSTIIGLGKREYSERFAELREKVKDKCKIGNNWTRYENPTAYELRSYGIYCYERQGIDSTAFSGHQSEKLVRLYLKGQKAVKRGISE